MHPKTAACAAALIAVGAAADTFAQTVQQLDPLSFGNFVVQSNAAPSTITVPLDGPVVGSGTVIVLASGAPGRFRIEGLTGNTIVGIDVAATPLFGAGVPSSQFFTITAFEHPATVITNALGEATFRLGATLSTSGTGVPYTDAAYSGTIDITVTVQ